MRELFNVDSPFMQTLNKIADLIIINVITVTLCILVIPGGAALTAMHFCLLQLVRGHESYILKTYFRVFARNFKAATVIWFLVLAIAVVLGSGFYIALNLPGLSLALPIVYGIIILIAYAILQWIFPLLSRFDNTIRGTLKNAAILALSQMPRTVGMMLMNIAFLALFLLFEGFRFFGSLCILTVPGYFSARMYSSVFAEFEGEDAAGTRDPDAWELEEEPERRKE